MSTHFYILVDIYFFQVILMSDTIYFVFINIQIHQLHLQEVFMNNNRSQISGISRTTHMIYIAMFTTLIAIGAFIRVPVPVCPFTLQFLFTTMAGLLLGGKRGAASVGIYILLGLAGVPIFAEGGGISYIFVPTFGYLIGFMIGTFVTGMLAGMPKMKSFGFLIFSNFVGLLIVYACGMAYYYVIGNYVIDSPIGIWPLFLYCFLLAVPGDLVLCVVAATLTVKLRKILGETLS